MLRVKVLHGTTRVANYYLTEEKHLGLNGKVNMPKEMADLLGFKYDDTSAKISNYVLAETGTLKNRWYGKLADHLNLNDKEVTQDTLLSLIHI